MLEATGQAIITPKKLFTSTQPFKLEQSDFVINAIKV